MNELQDQRLQKKAQKDENPSRVERNLCLSCLVLSTVLTLPSSP